MANVDLVLRLLAEDRASGKFKDVGNAASVAEKRLSKFKKVAAGISAAAITAFAVKSVKAFAEAETQQVRLEGAYKRFPKIADVSIGSLREMNAELQRTTKFDDDVIAGAQSIMAQFDLTGKQLKETTPLLLDYAAATGKDLPSAASTLGKALLGNTRALKEVGINYKVTGDKSKDFENITALLRKQVGGFAEEEGKTAAGQAAILSNQFGDLQETVGGALVPALRTMNDVLKPIVQAFNGLPEPVKTGTVVVGGLGTAFLLLAPKIAAAKALMADFSSASKSGGVGAAATNVGKFRGSLGKVAGFLGAAGPWGLAIGAGITALSLFGDNSEEAARAQGSFRAALDASNGALDEQVRKTVAVEAENRGLLATARELGLSEKDVVSAILGDVNARDKLAAATQRVLEKQVPYVNSGKSGTVVIDKQREAAKRLANGLDSLGVEFADQVEANNRVQSALGKTSAKIDALQRKAARGLTLKIRPQITGNGTIIIGAQGGGKQLLDVDYRANGGPVRAGRPYVVGEKRPELFVPSQSGTILPSVPGAGGAARVNVYLDGKLVQTSLVDLKRTQGGRLNF